MPTIEVSVEQIKEAISTLGPVEREEIRQSLFPPFDPESAEDQAVLELINHRLREVQEGRAQWIDGDEAFRRLRARPRARVA
jgi:hypothetical protein